MSNGPYNFIYHDIGGIAYFMTKKFLQPQLHVKKEYKTLYKQNGQIKTLFYVPHKKFCKTI